MSIQPVILSGGAGTRLWPLSRELYPKQLLNLYGEQSMLQETVKRLDGLSHAGAGSARDGQPEVLAPVIVCNEEHRFLVAEQLRQLNRQAEAIVLEPAGRNTAPALTVAAPVTRTAQHDPVLLVMPADHVIRRPERFHEAVLRGFALAAQGCLVTFGITPTAAETGYGYIRTGARCSLADVGDAAHYIASFVEKPDRKTAEQYLSSGEYLWNSGMFMMRASVWLEAIGRFREDIYKDCCQAITQAQNDRDFLRVGRDAFLACASDSIDYAVMEKVTRDGAAPADHQAVVVALDAGWSDVGAWPALLEISDRDDHGNVLKGDVVAIDTFDSLAFSQHRLVATVGLKDTVVVETADAVMVAHKDHAQKIKDIVAALKAQNRPQYQTHRRVYRPWGDYEGIDIGSRYQVKRITVNPGAALSLQMHHHRAEHWIVVKGTARVTRGDEVFLITENESTYIPVGVKHRLENPGSLPLEIIEVQSGSYLGEDDIVRFEDVYGREEHTRSLSE